MIRRSAVWHAVMGVALTASAWGQAIEDKEEPAPITNRWGEATTTRLELEETIIQRAQPGRSYHHHPHVIAADGVLYATFSSGRAHEDDVGQEVWFTRSTDKGATWTAPRAIEATRAIAADGEVCTATGLYAYRASPDAPLTLTAYFGVYGYAQDGLTPEGGRPPADAAHVDTRCMAVQSVDGGETWGAAGKAVDGVVFNLGPRPLANGRLLMPANATFAYTDDPSGLRDWRLATLPGVPPGHVDDSAGYQRALAIDPEGIGYCEGSWFQTDDGVVHMMLRTPRNRLACTQSRDSGETWARVRPTAFTDNCSRHQFGRLPDGRFFALSTPDPEAIGARTPLVLALSEDGVTFDRHFVVGDAPATPPAFEGLFKGGRYGYPHLAVVEDVVVVLYSVNKEHVAACRFPVALLDDANG